MPSSPIWSSHPTCRRADDEPDTGRRRGLASRGRPSGAQGWHRSDRPVCGWVVPAPDDVATVNTGGAGNLLMPLRRAQASDGTVATLCLDPDEGSLTVEVTDQQGFSWLTHRHLD